MWPRGGRYNVTPPPPKLKVLAWRFFFWITPRWLSRKYRYLVMRRIYRRDRAEVERQIREQLMAYTGGSKEREDQVMDWVKRWLNGTLQPRAKRSTGSQRGG